MVGIMFGYSKSNGNDSQLSKRSLAYSQYLSHNQVAVDKAYVPLYICACRDEVPPSSASSPTFPICRPRGLVPLHLGST